MESNTIHFKSKMSNFMIKFFLQKCYKFFPLNGTIFIASKSEQEQLQKCFTYTNTNNQIKNRICNTHNHNLDSTINLLFIGNCFT